MLTQTCPAGMTVAGLNFSHGLHDEHKAKIELIKRVRENLDMPIPITLDTKGPEYRIKTFKSGCVFEGLIRNLSICDKIHRTIEWE